MTAHTWQVAPWTGTKTCSRCHLLPLDQDDIETPCYPESVHVEGRRWFQSTYGNTYHTAEVFVSYSGKRTDEESIGIVPFSYGYGDQYLQSAHELLVEKGILPDDKSPHGGRGPLWRALEDLGIGFTYQVTDGLKRELHNEGRE